jgi:hypothetical protein
VRGFNINPASRTSHPLHRKVYPRPTTHYPLPSPNRFLDHSRYGSNQQLSNLRSGAVEPSRPSRAGARDVRWRVTLLGRGLLRADLEGRRLFQHGRRKPAGLRVVRDGSLPALRRAWAGDELLPAPRRDSREARKAARLGRARDRWCARSAKASNEAEAPNLRRAGGVHTVPIQLILGNRP